MAVVRLWPSTNGPSNADNASAVTLGTRFRLSAAGWITHLHYWRGTTADSGTHTGVIYLVSGGTQVAGTLVTFTDAGTGWQTAALPAPVQLAADTLYCAAVFHPDGGAVFTGSYWVAGGPGASGITNGILFAPNSAEASGQGVFNGGGSLAHPTGSFNQTNYWVDVSISDVNPNQISPAGIAPTGSVGQPAVLQRATITPAGSPAGSGTGQPAVTPGTSTIQPTGIAPGSALGQPALAGHYTIAPTGIPPGGAAGQPTVVPGAVVITVDGIAPTGDLGRPRISETGSPDPDRAIRPGPPHTAWSVGPPHL